MNEHKPNRWKSFWEEVLLLTLEVMAIFLSINAGVWESDLSQREGVYLEYEIDQEEKDKTKEKIIYLTFDDGPGEYTEQLLDILDHYDVKVTFFVTNQEPEYQDLIGEAYRRGHTIGLHSYSHDYGIYRCQEAYYEDLQLIYNLCKEQTGDPSRIIRFPGGSSNGVSQQYCYGIMTALSKSVEEYGFVYCDWNVSSGDMENAVTTDAVARNVIAGIREKDVAVVLQHDTLDYSVEAVSQIICWGQANGYTFLPLTENSPMVHHTVKN